MPQKKAKKAKVEKSKKPLKSVKNAGLGRAIKKVTKDAVKPAGLSVAKKVMPVKKGVSAKHEKVAHKAGSPKKIIVSSKGKIPSAVLLREKKDEAKKGAKAPALKPEAKAKGKEVVLEVPAPKGLALLTKEGKGKRGKVAESAAARQKRCREPGCEHDFTIIGYCRLHYIKNWRRIKRKEAILASGQLNNYVEELVNKYPDKYLDVIRQDLASEKEWAKVVVDLELENAEEEGGAEEDIDTVAEGVRPVAGVARGDFDDDSDAF